MCPDQHFIGTSSRRLVVADASIRQKEAGPKKRWGPGDSYRGARDASKVNLGPMTREEQECAISKPALEVAQRIAGHADSLRIFC